MKKLAAPYLASIVENLSLLEEVKQQVTERHIEILNSEEPHRLPKALRAQMIYYISVIAEGANNIIGTPQKEALAPEWFSPDETDAHLQATDQFAKQDVARVSELSR